MANCLFGYPDLTLTATSITGRTGSWQSALPLINLKTADRKVVTRTTGVGTYVYTIELPVATNLRIDAILNHNFYHLPTTTIKREYFSGTSLTTPIHDTGAISVWNPYYPDNTNVTATDAASWTVKPDNWYVIPTSVGAIRTIRVTINDTDNPAGFLEWGRHLLMAGYETTVNMSWGADIAWQQKTIKQSSIGDVDYHEITSQGRVINGEFAWLSEAESMTHIMERQRKIGLEGEMYFIFDPNNAHCALLKQRAMLCRNANIGAIKYPSFNVLSSPFSLEEIR